MNVYLLMFAAVVGVALCAPLTDTDEASLRLVQKTHKLYKAGEVDDATVDLVCGAVTGLSCQKPGTLGCTLVDTTCKAIKDPVGTLVGLAGQLSSLFGK